MARLSIARRFAPHWGEISAVVGMHAARRVPHENESRGALEAKHDHGVVVDPVGNGAKGGAARAQRMTPAERSEVARRAADARWGKSVMNAEYVGTLPVAEMSLDCVVLDDGRRVISQGSILLSLGRSETSGRRTRNDNRPPFVEAGNLVPFFTDELKSKFERVEYRLDGVIGTRQGYEAEILPLICEVYLAAREAGVLTPQQLPAAQQAEILVRGLSRVGIIALVDEATGYQDVRARDALATILEAWVTDELQPWVKTFDVEFYKQLFRLRGIQFDPASVKRPSYFGHLTNDVVYKRVAPGVFDEIKAQRAADETKRKAKFFQQLTDEVGHPKLREHLASVTTIMKLSSDWTDFKKKLDQIHPIMIATDQMQLWDDSSTVGL